MSVEQPVLLAVVAVALGAGQHRVVVGQHARSRDARRRCRCRRPARRPACARSAPRPCAAPRWAAIDERAVLHEAARVDRSSMFSRAVRRPRDRRRCTASGRRSSSTRRCRSIASATSGRSAAAGAVAARSPAGGSSRRLHRPRGDIDERLPGDDRHSGSTRAATTRTILVGRHGYSIFIDSSTTNGAPAADDVSGCSHREDRPADGCDGASVVERAEVVGHVHRVTPQDVERHDVEHRSWVEASTTGAAAAVLVGTEPVARR